MYATILDEQAVIVNHSHHVITILDSMITSPLNVNSLLLTKLTEWVFIFIMGLLFFIRFYVKVLFAFFQARKFIGVGELSRKFYEKIFALL